MKTADLAALLARGTPPMERHPVEKRFARALAAGMAGAAMLLLAVYGVRSDMPQVLAAPLFWVRAAFPLAVATAALYVASRLARPAAHVGMAWLALALPLFAVWIAGALFVVEAPPGMRLGLVLGSTWQVCTFNIVLLSLPTFAAMLWAMKGLAPTRLALAGAGSGLLAGAQAVLVYTLYCIEMAPSFWAVWYVLGMAVPTLAGACLGPRLLRW